MIGINIVISSKEKIVICQRKKVKVLALRNHTRV